MVEALVVRVLDEEGRRRPRASAGEDVDDVEHLEAADDRVDDEEEGRRAQQGPRDVEEPLPARGAIDRSGLVDLTRNALQASEVDDHSEADALPRADEDDGDESPGAVALPVDGGQADAREHLVEDADDRVEETQEDDPGRDPGDDDGHVEQGPEEPARRHPAVEQQGSRQAAHDADRDRDGGYISGIFLNCCNFCYIRYNLYY